MNYWLFKSEPDEYSLDDLANEKQGFGVWDGIRNYQARNILRDQVSVNDKVLFYYSSCKIPGVAGVAQVVKSAYPDPAQFDPSSKYYDSKATPEKPRWFCVDVKSVKKFDQVVTLKSLKMQQPLSEMTLLKQGRLSVQPVTESEWHYILTLAKAQ